MNHYLRKDGKGRGSHRDAIGGHPYEDGGRRRTVPGRAKHWFISLIDSQLPTNMTEVAEAGLLVGVFRPGDEDGGGSGMGGRAKTGRKRTKMRAPQREGWLEVYEEKTRVAFLETDRREYSRKWVLLRDCWLYLYTNQEDVMRGRDAESVMSIDLRGSLCQRQPRLERTFFLESSALYTIHGHKHKMLFRTAAEQDVRVRETLPPHT